MKNVFPFITLLSILLISCSKNNTSAHLLNPDNSIVGEWNATEYFISPGDAGKWYPIKDNTSIKIQQDSTYQQINNGKEEKGILGITTKWNAKAIYLRKNGSSDSLFYFLSVRKDTMELWGVGCIEGCATRFIKTK